MPDEPIQLTKRTTRTISFAFGLIDTGVGLLSAPMQGSRTPDAVHVQLGYQEPNGLVDAGEIQGPLPEPYSVYLRTDPHERGWIRNIALAVDPLVPHPDWNARQRYLAERSYTRALSALYAGSLTLMIAPFPQLIPVSELNLVRYDPTYHETLAPNWPNQQPIFNWNLLPEIAEDTHAEVLLQVPNRTNYQDRTGDDTWYYAWTGIVSIALETDRYLGAIGAEGTTTP